MKNIIDIFAVNLYSLSQRSCSKLVPNRTLEYKGYTS